MNLYTQCKAETVCWSIPADPNTQILYACDSCGEKFLDASSLAQHVRIHTAQALVMFQADSDFYQQYTGDGTWQTTEQVIQGGELLFRTREEESEEDEAVDVDQTENLTKELLDIRLEMQRYQQDRKQLQYVNLYRIIILIIKVVVIHYLLELLIHTHI